MHLAHYSGWPTGLRALGLLETLLQAEPPT
jgi:hypothetical protein